MTTEEFEKLRVGDMVRIVSKWDPHGKCSQNNRGLMDEWLGKEMTIANIGYGTVYMVEDDQRWTWNRHCFEPFTPLKPATESELADFLLCEWGGSDG